MTDTEHQDQPTPAAMARLAAFDAAVRSCIAYGLMPAEDLYRLVGIIIEAAKPYLAKEDA